MDKSIEMIYNYIKNNEKPADELKLGAEFEHILLDKDANTLGYFDRGGTGDLFREMEALGWEANREGENILSISKGNIYISTEPGGQLEFSTIPLKSIDEIKEAFKEFYLDASMVLKDYDSNIYNIGFQPKTNVDDIKILPKERYYAMYDYFKTSGKMGKYMMKGTASLQLSIDYTNEKDYGKKYSMANRLSNILYMIFDNAPFFKDRPYEGYALRSKIWNNTDRARTGMIERAFRLDFGYEDYAKYLAENDAIYILKDGEFKRFNGKIKDAIDQNTSKEELEHLMTMVFPDVRTKKFIEIRQIDSIPYPYNLGAIAFLKNLFYNEDNLEQAWNLLGDMSYKEAERARIEMYEKGFKTKIMGQSIDRLAGELLSMIDIDKSDEKYIKPIYDLFEGKSLKNLAIESWENYAMVQNAISDLRVRMEVFDVQ